MTGLSTILASSTLAYERENAIRTGGDNAGGGA